MNYCFDEIIDRKNTNSLKHDFAVERGKPTDVLPLWVADMDFRTPPDVVNELLKSSSHGIFGYSDTKQDYFDTLKQWFLSSFDWQIKDSWLIKTPGVVFALCAAIRSLTKEGDAIIIQTPVYYPFFNSILVNKRVAIHNPLVFTDGCYQMDLKDFETKIIENNVKMFILCSPHNPVGRVWTKEELTRLGDICVKYDVIVVSDEIHADIVYHGYKHHVFASLKPEFLGISVTCTSPSKTFNLAGLQISNIFIANEEIKRKFKLEITKCGYDQVNILGIKCCQAAYLHGREWLDQLKVYLKGNLDFIRSFLLKHLPEIKLIEPQGTYLVWLDFRELNLNEKQMEDLIVNKAKLWLDTGTMFGSEGAGFERINIACPRAILEKAFLQLEKAVKER